MISTGIVCREFIGRAIELDFLTERVFRLQTGRGSTLVLNGTAGIGKSRLAREVLDTVRSAGIRCAATACAPFGETPYGPVIGLADAIGLPEIGDLLRSLDAGASNVARERNRRFNECAAAFGAAAQREPVLAVVEDLHWADPATLELLAHLITALREHPVVFFVTRREDEAPIDPHAARLLESIERDADAILTLNSLTREEIRALIASALREDGRRISTIAVDEIATLSDGRPFHIEELLRGMLERAPASSAQTAASVPRSLRAAVVERLASFSDDERIALAHAAVIGQRFDPALLGDLLELPLRDVLRILRKARNAQLVVEDSSGEGFAFRHALTREVVYDEILRAEARIVHARIAARMIERGDDPVPIAYHAWRSGDRELSQRWNTRCGDNAANLYAHVDAIRHYERAFSDAASVAIRNELAERVARAYYAIGELREAADWFATAIAETPDDPDRSHRLALERARALFESGAYDTGIAEARAVITALSGADSAVRFEAETLCAALLSTLGRAVEAMAHLDAAAALRTEREPHWGARFLGISAQTLHGLKEIQQSTAAFAEAEAAIRAIGDRELLVRTLNNHAHLRAECGDMRGSARILGEALASARELQASRLIAWLQNNRAYNLLMLADFDAAIEANREAAAIDHGVASVYCWVRALNVRLGTLIGNDALIADASIERALDDALELGNENAAEITAGAAILWRQSLGETGDAIAERFLSRTAGAHEHWLAEAAPRLRPDLSAQIRARIAAAAAPAHALGMQASLLLLDARLALRQRRRDEADVLAKEAVDRFRALEWPIEEAYARAVRGGVRDAVVILRRVGADAEAARLTAIDERVPRRRGETTLTTREREIATQIGAGKTNREVAETLVISERTVETHVASIYGKLGISNRKDLATLLNPPG